MEEMNMKSVKIGFAPTRRSIFSAPDAVKYANLTRERLKELGVEFVDICGKFFRAEVAV